MNAMQVRFNKISSADFRSKSNEPWKPEVTPPRRRGGFSRGRVADNSIMCSKMTDLRIMILVAKMGIMVREMGVVPLEIEGKVEEILEVHSMVKVEDEVDSIKAQILDAKE